MEPSIGQGKSPMSQSTPTVPEDAIIIKYTREREFPLSAVASVALHAAIVVIIVFGLMAGLLSKDPKPVSFEVVDLVGAPGGGRNGNDDGTRLGNLVGSDQAKPIENLHQPPLSTLPPVATPKIQPEPEKPVINNIDDPTAKVEQSAKNLPALPDLQGMVRGLKGGDLNQTGQGGRGSGGDNGAGNQKGLGNGGKLSPTLKQKRQLRWTLLFRISSAANYLDQLKRMGAILGVQYQDQSIKLITNLERRPAKLEPGDRVPDRIFWMDDSVDSVRSIATELQIGKLPWRLIAFFPDKIELELLRREAAYGKAYGRMTEDDIRETVFRVEDDYGQIRLTVVRQVGMKK